MGDISSQIEKLEKNNYQPWRFRMKNYLIGKNMWRLVTREEPPPELSTQPSEEQVRQFNQWNERDKRGIFFLSQHISNSMIGHIQELTTSKQVWDTLERLYFISTKARKIQLKSELNNLRKSPSITINDYILRVKELADALGSIG